jgi:PTS system nitrogen regulatory IIA component
MDSRDSEQMLSTEEVSKWLGVATRTLCTWAECSEIPALKIGRMWRFRRSDLVQWLEERKHNLSPKPAASAAVAASAAYRSAKRAL